MTKAFYIGTEIAEMIIKGDVYDGCTICIDATGGTGEASGTSEAGEVGEAGEAGAVERKLTFEVK